MIVPMIKYAFLVYHRDFDAFLKNLQELGVVDIIRQNHELTDEDRVTLGRVNRFNAAIKALQLRQPQAGEFTSAEAIVDELEALTKEQEQQEIAIKKAQKELNEVLPWGNFNPEAIKELGDKGIKVRFFTTSEKSYSPEWENEMPIEVINRVAGQVYFVVLQQNEEIEFTYDAAELKAPLFSYSQKEEEIKQFEQRISDINVKLDQLAAGLPLLQQEHTKMVNDLDFKEVAYSANKEANDSLMILQGWVPQPQNDELVKFLEKESIIYISERAAKTDNAPILLKNNRFAKLFEPIGALFTSPTYGELDLTPLFAPFFMLFFGFCLGDAGYGILLLLGATIAKFKVKKEMKPLLSLVQWLSVATVLFGAITGTLFGISLVDVDIPILDGFKKYIFDQNNMFNLALGLGAIQIIFGMFVKAANQIKLYGWVHSLSTFGWLLLLLGSAAVYGLSTKEGSEIQLFGNLHIGILAVAGIGIFFFNSPGKNPFINVGLGLWDSYNMATGLFGDLLSYIRLFALGLSSGILGNVFNSLAFGMSPDIPVVGAIITVLILIVGHSINLFMSALGSLVHPMRLTFVEFYKNAGFTGGGKGYTPFKKQNVNV